MPAMRLFVGFALSCAVATAVVAGQPMIPTGGPVAAAPAVAPVPPATVGSTAASAPTTAPMDPFVKDLLAKLNSPDAAQREAAQKQLASFINMMQQPEALKRLQDVSPDKELKDFFGSRITQLRAIEEEKRLTNLPLITLKLSNATLFQMVAELNKAVGLPSAFMTQDNGNPGNGRTFTIDVKDKPFWEVYSALTDQQSIELQNYGDGQPPRLYISGNAKSPYTIVSGPSMAWITNINYDRSVNFQVPPGSRQPPTLNVNFTIAIDPRIKATRVKQPTNIKVVDDEGRTIPSPNNGGGYNGGNSVVFGMNVSLTPPERLGKTMNLTFDSGLTTTVGDTKTTIDDIAKNIDKPITIGTRVLRLTNLNMDNPSYVNMTINVEPLDRSNGYNYDQRTPISVVDSAGRVMYSSTISYGGMGVGFNTNNAKPPYKVEISVPGRAVDLPLHFEFKEVPLP